MAAYYCPEPASRRAEAVLSSHTGPTISWLTMVELVSAVARKVRERALEATDAHRIANTFKTHLDGGYYRVVKLDYEDYEDARLRISRFDSALRTLDALHLAVAVREKLSIVTADDALASAAQKSGIEVFFIEADATT